MRVELTRDEYEFAIEEAHDQRRRALENGRQHFGKQGASEDDQLWWHLLGMLGEIAVSRVTGHPVTSHRIYDPRATDVGPYQVKSTTKNRNLIVAERDQKLGHKPFTPYILCWVGMDPRVVTLVGWASFAEIATDEYWVDSWRKWLVPFTHLHSIDELL